MRITVPRVGTVIILLLLSTSPSSMTEAGKVAFSTGHPSLLAGAGMACSAPTTDFCLNELHGLDKGPGLSG